MPTLKVKNNGVWEKVAGGGSGGGGGAQVQADYAQNDSSAMDYIKNRPFYAETKTIFDQDVTAELMDGLCGYIYNECIIDINATNNGDIFYVTMDGVTYPCVFSTDMYMIGNFYVFLEVLANSYEMTVDQLKEVMPMYANFTDTGEPFVIGFDDSVSEDGTSNAMTMFFTREAGTYHFTIEGGIIKKLDSKFLNTDELLPAVTANNNGQMLGVVNGVWAVTNTPSSLPEVTTNDNDKVLMVVNGAWIAGSIANGDEVYY